MPGSRRGCCPQVAFHGAQAPFPLPPKETAAAVTLTEVKGGFTAAGVPV